MTQKMILAGFGATAALLLSTTALAAPAQDAEMMELKAQLKAMSERLAQLEAQQQETQSANAAYRATSVQTAEDAAALSPAASAKVATAKAAGGTPAAPLAKGEGQPVVGGSQPGSFKLPGTNTSMKFGGYAKLDAMMDVNGAYGAQFANFAAIPLDNSASGQYDRQFNMHARQSRLNLETHTPTSLGDMKTFLEFDFFGSARGNANTTNGEGVMLRQAYGQVGHVLAGQTWSNFMDMNAYPESLDYIGSAGLSFNRNPQIRYTGTEGKMTYSGALESANSDGFSATANDVNLADAPDLTLKAEYKDADMGSLALRGVARHLKTANNASLNEGSDFGWGLGVSGKLKAFEKDAFMFQGVYGQGIGRYLFDVANSGNGNTIVDGQIDTQTAWGGYASYQHVWSPDWRSNIIAGYTGIDNDTAITGTAVNETVASGHINLLWTPDPAYRVGVEYMHGYRELESGVNGDLDRIQTSFMYLF